MKIKEIIKQQKRINIGRLKRAMVILEAFGDMDEKECDERAGAGYQHLLTLSKDKILTDYLDYLDLVMIGLTLTNDNDDNE